MSGARVSFWSRCTSCPMCAAASVPSVRVQGLECINPTLAPLHRWPAAAGRHPMHKASCALNAGFRCAAPCLSSLHGQRPHCATKRDAFRAGAAKPGAICFEYVLKTPSRLSFAVEAWLETLCQDAAMYICASRKSHAGLIWQHCSLPRLLRRLPRCPRRRRRQLWRQLWQQPKPAGRLRGHRRCGCHSGGGGGSAACWGCFCGFSRGAVA